MIKTKQWFLTVILAAIAVFALFFGLAISSESLAPMQASAESEKTSVEIGEFAQTINYQNGLKWDFEATNTDNPSESFWSLNNIVGVETLPEPLNNYDFWRNNLIITQVQENFGEMRPCENGSEINAGLYIVTVDFNGGSEVYEWATDEFGTAKNTFVLEVNPVSIDLSDFNAMHWVLMSSTSGSSNLTSGRVYHYTYTANGSMTTKHYYSISQLSQAPDSSWGNWTSVGYEEVDSSIVRFSNANGATHRIALYFEGVELDSAWITYSNNAYNEVGSYTARATINLPENCNYTLTTQISGENFDSLTSRGMKITIDEGSLGRRAIIEKTWYLCKYNNALLDEQASTLGSTETFFEMSDWVFGSDPQIAFPRLQHDRTDAENALPDATSALTFSIFDENGFAVCERLTKDKWNDYINKFMPAGNYRVTFHVETVTLGKHIHWWNNSVSNSDGSAVDYIGFDRTYNLTVKAAPLVLDESLVNAFHQQNAANFTDSIKVNGLVYSEFFARINKLGTGGLITVDSLTSEAGYWATSAGRSHFDSAPVYKFNLARMYSSHYLEASDERWANYISTPSKYTVYYRVEMKNYEMFPSMGDERYEHFFYVDLYKVIEHAPVIASMSFDGTPKRPLISNVDGEEMYYEIADKQATYTNAGSYTVDVKIRNEFSGFVRWSDNDTTGIKGVQFVITPVHNYWSKTPNIQGWKYGNYVPNSYSAEAHYFDAAAGDKLIYKFYRLDESGKRGAEVTLSNNLAVGNYEMVVTMIAHENSSYSGIDPASVRFSVSKIDNYWDETPTIIPWQYGQYNPAINSPTSKPHFAGADDVVRYYYYKVDENGNILQNTQTADLAAFNNKSGYTPVGRYALMAVLELSEANSANYTTLTSTVYFNVIPTGNYWAQTPNNMRWRYGDYRNELAEPNIRAVYFDPETDALSFFYYKTKLEGGKYVKDESTKTNDLKTFFVGGQLPVGNYILEAVLTVGEDNDYAGLRTDFEFVITQANNYWTKTPDVIGWEVGGTPVIPEGEAAFGSVVITIKAEGSDTVLYSSGEGGVNLLSGCMAGKYVMVAKVEGTDNYTAIEKSLTFRVFPSTKETQTFVTAKATDADNNEITATASGVSKNTSLKLDLVNKDGDTAELYSESEKILLSAGYDVGAAFKLSLLDAGQKVIQPDGSVEVTITIPQSLKNNNNLEVGIIVDGAFVKLGGNVGADGSSITFQTDKLDNVFVMFTPVKQNNAILIVAIVALILLAVALVVGAVIIIKRSNKYYDAVIREARVMSGSHRDSDN